MILIVYPQRCLILCIMSLLLVKGTRTMHLFFQDSTVNHGATCNQIRFHFNLFGICRFLTVALYISWCQARQLLGTQKGSPQWLHTACPKVHANQMVYELVNGLCCVADLANCHWAWQPWLSAYVQHYLVCSTPIHCRLVAITEGDYMTPNPLVYDSFQVGSDMYMMVVWEGS